MSCHDIIAFKDVPTPKATSTDKKHAMLYFHYIFDNLSGSNLSTH